MSRVIGVRILWVLAVLNGMSAVTNALRGDWGIVFAVFNFAMMCYCLITIDRIKPKTKE